MVFDNLDYLVYLVVLRADKNVVFPDIKNPPVEASLVA